MGVEPVIAMLHLHAFRKAYHQHLVLQIDAFTIRPGVYWLRGRNGSGKSSLLTALAGITAFEGNVHLDQVSLRQQPVAYRRLVNFAEAEPIFPPFLTGTELIQLVKAAKQAPAHQEVFYLESMGMNDYVNQPVGSYSSGMLKKLSLVLAFLGQPRCLLLDEPLTTLEVDALPVLYDWIARLSQQTQAVVLLSSHQPLEAGGLLTGPAIVVAQTTIRFTA